MSEAAIDPEGGEEWTALEADLRLALQHQKAAYERMQETQRELDELRERARALLARRADAAASASSPPSEPGPPSPSGPDG